MAEEDKVWYKSIWTWVIMVVALAVGFGVGWASGAAGGEECTPDRSEPVEIPPPGYGDSAEIMAFISSMTVDEKIGQMVLADLSLFVEDVDIWKINKTRTVEILKEYPFGSVFNSPSTDWDTAMIDASVWQELVGALQEASEEAGTIFPLYGVDTVHGANYVSGAAIFPQQLALGCSFNRAHARVMGEVGGKDTRAAGIAWNFSPILDLATHPGWPRNFETWGESPFVAAELSKELINGYQGDNGTELHLNTKIAACVKHFLGYAAALNGFDRSPVNLGRASLMNIHYAVYEEVFNVNPATIMSGYHSLNDDPTAGSVTLLKTLLRDIQGYSGMMVTDFNTADELMSLHHMVPTVKDGVKLMFKNTTTDVSMSAFNAIQHFDYFRELYDEGVLSDSDLDVATYRMLRLKEKIGWNLDRDHRPGLTGWTDYYGDATTVGQTADWDAALDAARESVVLVKNDGILPLDTSANLSILVTGPSSHSAPWMSGGWTCHWQGCVRNDQLGKHVTLKEYFEANADFTVSYSIGLLDTYPTTEEADKHIANALAAAQTADYVIVGLGEPTYTERVGNIDDITLDAVQLDLIRQLQALPTNTIIVLYEGRPRYLPPDVIDNANAILIGYRPGPLGGQAAGEIIVGETNPNALLSFGYPGATNEAPFTHYHKYSFSSTLMYDQFHQSGGVDFCHTDCYGKPQWEFGHGLSYSTWSFEILSPANNAVFVNSPDISVEVEVKVTNEGPYDGKWPVLLFVSDLYRVLAAPEYKLIEAFDKVELANGASETLTFTLSKKAFEFHTASEPFADPVIEDGTFVLRVGVGDQEVMSNICIGTCEE